MRPLSRRGLLRDGALGIAGLAAATFGLSSSKTVEPGVWRERLSDSAAARSRAQARIAGRPSWRIWGAPPGPEIWLSKKASAVKLAAWASGSRSSQAWA